MAAPMSRAAIKDWLRAVPLFSDPTKEASGACRDGRLFPRDRQQDARDAQTQELRVVGEDDDAARCRRSPAISARRARRAGALGVIPSPLADARFSRRAARCAEGGDR
jgi:hypothetical protein